MTTLSRDSGTHSPDPPHSLSELLDKYRRDAQFGSEDEELTKRRLENLPQDLAALQKSNSGYLRVIFGAVLVLLIVQIVLAIVNFQTMQNISLLKGLVSGVFGVTCGGLIKHLIDLYKQKTKTETLLLLAKNANEKTMQTIINIIAKGG